MGDAVRSRTGGRIGRRELRGWKGSSGSDRWLSPEVQAVRIGRLIQTEAEHVQRHTQEAQRQHGGVPEQGST